MIIQTLDISVDGHDSTVIVVIDIDAGMKIVGMVEVSTKGYHVADFRRLFVSEDYRLRGLGKELIAAVCGHARIDGCASISCQVQKKNLEAWSFYNRLGFAVFYELEDGNLLMSKSLFEKEVPGLDLIHYSPACGPKKRGVRS